MTEEIIESGRFFAYKEMLWRLLNDGQANRHSELVHMVSFLFSTSEQTKTVPVRVSQDKERACDDATENTQQPAIYYAAKGGHSGLVEAYLAMLVISCAIRLPRRCVRKIIMSKYDFETKTLTFPEWLSRTKFFNKRSAKHDLNKIEFEEWVLSSLGDAEMMKVFSQNEYTLSGLLYLALGGSPFKRLLFRPGFVTGTFSVNKDFDNEKDNLLDGVANEPGQAKEEGASDGGQNLHSMKTKDGGPRSNACRVLVEVAVGDSMTVDDTNSLISTEDDSFCHVEDGLFENHDEEEWETVSDTWSVIIVEKNDVP
jgi:hypothetical protein